MEIIQTILRALQFLWILLITSLIGAVIDGAIGGNQSSINYAIFVAVFCWIVLIFGIAAAFMEALNIPIVLLVLDGLAAVFTFIAAIVLSAKLGVHSCSNESYTHNNSLTNGGHDYERRCRELQASCAFFWFLWLTFMASLVMSGLNSRGGGGSASKTRKGPVMTQA